MTLKQQLICAHTAAAVRKVESEHIDHSALGKMLLQCIMEPHCAHMCASAVLFEEEGHLQRQNRLQACTELGSESCGI